MSNNLGRVVTRFTFSQIFSRAWYCGMTMEKHYGWLSNYWHLSIQPPCFTPSWAAVRKFQLAFLGEKTGLRFIPLYTPTHHHQLPYLSDRSCIYPRSQPPSPNTLKNRSLFLSCHPNPLMTLHHPQLTIDTIRPHMTKSLNLVLVPLVVDYFPSLITLIIVLRIYFI